MLVFDDIVDAETSSSPCAVADLSVMLALMASRNGAEVMSVVRNGEVQTLYSRL